MERTLRGAAKDDRISCRRSQSTPQRAMSVERTDAMREILTTIRQAGERAQSGESGTDATAWLRGKLVRIEASRLEPAEGATFGRESPLVRVSSIDIEVYGLVVWSRRLVARLLGRDVAWLRRLERADPSGAGHWEDRRARLWRRLPPIARRVIQESVELSRVREQDRQWWAESCVVPEQAVAGDEPPLVCLGFVEERRDRYPIHWFLAQPGPDRDLEPVPEALLLAVIATIEHLSASLQDEVNRQREMYSNRLPVCGESQALAREVPIPMWPHASRPCVLRGDDVSEQLGQQCARLPTKRS